MIATLKWWFIFVASAAGVGVATFFGSVAKLWDIDQTKLSFVILALFFLVSPFIGWLTWRLDKGLEVRHLSQHVRWFEESSELMMRIAIAATTLGFFLMIMATFGAGGTVNQAVIADAAKGLGIIYLVTFVGVSCSSILNLQIVNLVNLISLRYPGK